MTLLLTHSIECGQLKFIYAVCLPCQNHRTFSSIMMTEA